jgi:hypothetical protein
MQRIWRQDQLFLQVWPTYYTVKFTIFPQAAAHLRWNIGLPHIRRPPQFRRHSPKLEIDFEKFCWVFKARECRNRNSARREQSVPWNKYDGRINPIVLYLFWLPLLVCTTARFLSAPMVSREYDRNQLWPRHMDTRCLQNCAFTVATSKYNFQVRNNLSTSVMLTNYDLRVYLCLFHEV